MTVQAQVLGEAGRDNAALLRVDSGQSVARLLLDCGAGCPDTLAPAELHDVGEDEIETYRFELSEAFAVCHRVDVRPRAGLTILETAHYRVEALALNHGTPSLGYVVREAERVNVATDRLPALGLRPGAWLQALKGSQPDDAELEVDGVRLPLGSWRERLLVRTPGQNAAYLTDFLLDDATLARLATALRGCDLLLCESQYRQADASLAARNFHLTAVQAAQLAAACGAGQLLLFHLSDRYPPAEWQALLDEARAIFPATAFPDHWRL